MLHGDENTDDVMSEVAYCCLPHRQFIHSDYFYSTSSS